jgi:hypothetical protein
MGGCFGRKTSRAEEYITESINSWKIRKMTIIDISNLFEKEKIDVKGSITPKIFHSKIADELINKDEEVNHYIYAHQSILSNIKESTNMDKFTVEAIMPFVFPYLDHRKCDPIPYFLTIMGISLGYDVFMQNVSEYFKYHSLSITKILFNSANSESNREVSQLLSDEISILNEEKILLIAKNMLSSINPSSEGLKERVDKHLRGYFSIITDFTELRGYFIKMCQVKDTE